MSLAVSARFARALVEIALDPKNGLDPVGVAEQLSSFDVAIRESSELHTVLLLPAIPPAKKTRLPTVTTATPPLILLNE